jgi:hypothetical protein
MSDRGPPKAVEEEGSHQRVVRFSLVETVGNPMSEASDPQSVAS